MENVKFNTLNISDEILRALDEMGFTEATPIQSQAIPAVMTGRDVIGQAQTGTGKTAAFGCSILNNMKKSLKLDFYNFIPDSVFV